MSERLTAALAEYLRAVETGANPDGVLARYPDLADELRGLLAAAEAARPAGHVIVPRRSQVSSRARFLARAASLRAAPRPGGLFSRGSWPSRVAALGMMVALVLGLGSYGVVAASAESLPGDPLYGVKRSVEQVELVLASDPSARDELESTFDARRLAEAQIVVQQRRPVSVEFSGRIDQQTGRRWTIHGLAVTVPAEANDLVIGEKVSVLGHVGDDGVVTVEKIVLLTAPAPRQPTLEVHASPTGEAERANTATPEPTETQEAEPTRAEPATAPAMEASPQPTATRRLLARPTSTAQPTEGHETPEPTQASEPNHVPEPTQAHEPTHAPEATSTSQPSTGSGPTATPHFDDHGGGGPSPSNTPRP